MKNLYRFFLLGMLLIITLHAGEFESRHFKLIKLTEGVYAAIHKPGGSAICNAGIVDMGDYVLIFDTFMTPIAAEDLKKAAMDLFQKPIRIVVNSHGHSDHIRGNQIFPEAFVIGTETMREFIQSKNKPEEEKERIDQQLAKMEKMIAAEKDEKKKNELRIWVQYYQDVKKSLPRLKIIFPDVSLKEKVVIHGQKRTAILHSYQKGHTVSDIILYIPEERILFAGDLIFHKMHPYMSDGFPDSWMANLDSLVSYKPMYVVPGHGEVGNASIINEMIDYIKTIKQLAKQMIKEGKDANDEKQLPAVPEKLKNYQFQNFYTRNIQFMINYIKK
jgi:glyoxylase-like metal-dependent hydrolase (beta-lactamase superfamily II)